MSASATTLRGLGILTAVAAGALWVANVSWAQDSAGSSKKTPTFATACKADIQSNCKDAKGRAVMTCLRDHEDQLSPTCKTAFEKRMAARAPKRTSTAPKK